MGVGGYFGSSQSVSVERAEEMKNHMIRTMRVKDGNATPIDVSVDFTGYGAEELGEDVLFFEIEQDQSVFLSIDGIKSALAAAEILKAELERKFE